MLSRSSSRPRIRDISGANSDRSPRNRSTTAMSGESNSDPIESPPASDGNGQASDGAMSAPAVAGDVGSVLGEPRRGTITIVDLPVNEMRPNAWNPNRMTDEAFAEYVTEVRRLGRLPKPIVVRPVRDGYQIVDGEHAHKAATKLGFAVVPCEVTDLDDFTAMLETLKRNQHGTHDPLLEAELFERMAVISGESGRQLAKRLSVSPATVANRLKYVTALRLRQARLQTMKAEGGNAPDSGAPNPCASEADRRLIAALSLKQVELYLDLPHAFRDRWLDAGGPVSIFAESFPSGDSILSAKHALEQLDDAGLADLVDPDILQFGPSVEYALSFADFGLGLMRLENGDEYLRAVADVRLPANVLDLLPLKRDGKALVALLDPAAWRRILAEARKHSARESQSVDLVVCGVQTALKKAGVNLGDVYGPRVTAMLQDLEAAPEAIRDAEFLSIEERWLLHKIVVDGDQNVVVQAKQLALEYLRQQRAGDGADRADPPRRAERASVRDVLQVCVLAVMRRRQLEAEEKLFSDRGELLGSVLAAMAGSPAIRDGTIAGHPAVEVLADQIRALPEPMLHIVAGLAVGDPPVETAGRRWMAVQGDQGVVAPVAREPSKAKRRRKAC